MSRFLQKNQWTLYTLLTGMRQLQDAPNSDIDRRNFIPAQDERQEICCYDAKNIREERKD